MIGANPKEARMTEIEQVRELLARQLDWGAAHVGYVRAVADFPAELRAVVPHGLTHSGWQVVEHIRLAQADILDFCVNPDYVARPWPESYWPGVAPRDEAEWEASVADYQRDLRTLQKLALDEKTDLFTPIPGDDGQTILRELLLVADHGAYHVGQLVAMRQTLDCWH
jgi:uncharacterized damage-inducible protein DinB